MKKILSLILAVLCMFAVASCGKKAEDNTEKSTEQSMIDFDFDMSKEDVAQLRADDEKSDKFHYANVDAYIVDDVLFFEGEDVTVLYHFDADSGKLKKVTYDLTGCDDGNIEKMKESFDKNYNQVWSDDTEMQGVPMTETRWEKDGMIITFNQMTIDSHVRTSLLVEKRGNN